MRDTGRGLTAAQLADLFEPFNRFGAESEGIEGTGIGLTIVKALVEGMGGAIARVQRPGLGTVFEVALPAAGGRCRRARGRRAEAPVARSRRRRRRGQVLYIEDNRST